MKKISMMAIVFAVVFFAFRISSAEESINVTSRDLLTNLHKFDQVRVAFKGEVIGDVMRRGEFAWLNVQDDYNTIGVWAPWELARRVQQAGDYLHRGDVVKVEGLFLRADPQLNGELCIKAETIQILQPGQKVFHVIPPAKVRAVEVLSLVVLCLLGLRLIVKRGKHKG